MVRRVAPTTPTPRWAQPACTWGKRAWVRHPPFFGRFGGVSLGPQSACCPPQLGVASQRWRHAWDDPPPPQYQGGVRSSSLRDLAGPPRWLLPSEGSRQPSCSPRTPRRNPSPLTERQRNDEPVHGFLHGGARASRSGPDPPPIRGLPRSEGEAQARFHLSSGHPWVSREGGRGGFLISRTPLTEPELSLHGRHKATRACARAFGFWAPATGRVLTPAQSEA